MPFGIQPWHLILIVIVALIVFGPARLPELGHLVGKALTEFRRGSREMADSFREEMSKDSAQPGQPVQPAPLEPGSPVIAPPANSVAAAPAPAPSAAAAVNKCAACGTVNPAGARFCNNCGAALTQ